MKRLIYEAHNGGNFPSTHRYYTFDSEEEYKAFESHLRANHREGWARFDIDIVCEPRVVVSDGFATYGGKHIKGKGCTEWSSGVYSSWHYYYLNPATIEKCEDAKTETWWA